LPIEWMPLFVLQTLIEDGSGWRDEASGRRLLVGSRTGKVANRVSLE